MDFNDLKQYVGSPDSDDVFVQGCFDEAMIMVDEYVAAAQVPNTVLDRCYLELGSELYHRRNAPSGISQFGTVDGAVFISRDPMKSVYPMLARYVMPL